MKHSLVSISVPRRHSWVLCAGDMAVSVDRVSAAIVWTVQPLAPRSEGLRQHLRSDTETRRHSDGHTRRLKERRCLEYRCGLCGEAASWYGAVRP